MQCLDDERAKTLVHNQVTSEEMAWLKEESRHKDELLLESQREADSYKKDAAKLQEEVQAKTAQVKQYKKQIDSLQQGHSTGQQQQQLTAQHQQTQTQDEIEKVCASVTSAHI